MITADIEKLVENDLQLSCELPREGIVAGQFVASLFYKHLDLPLKQPMNDIDIFIDNKIETATNHTFRTFRWNKNIVSKNPSKFKDNLKSAFFRGYSIIKSEIFENEKNEIPVNIITTSPTFFIDLEDFSSQIQNQHILSKKIKKEYVENIKNLSPEMIINNFDINCCAVAYNLKTRTFHYTDEFKSFLCDFKLRINSAHSPHSTLLRLHKKIKDIDCSPDIEDEINFISFYSSMFPKYSKKEISSFKYGKRFMEVYKQETNEIVDSILEFKSNQYVNIKNTTKEIIVGEEGYEHLHTIYNKLSSLKDLEQDFLNVNLVLNLYYSCIGVIKNNNNIEYIEKMIKAKHPKKTENLAFHWFLKKIAFLPFGNYNISDIEKELPITVMIEKDAHLIFSLMSYFEEPHEMESFSKNFINSNGEYDKAKGELFKYHNKELYEIKNSNFNIKKYKPKMIFPFFYQIKNKEQALWIDTLHNFSLQLHFQTKDSKFKVFVLKFGKSMLIPFFLRNSTSTENGSFSEHVFNFEQKNKQICWHKLKFQDIFKDISFIDGNDEKECFKTEQNKKILRIPFIIIVSLAFYFRDVEFSNKEDRKNNLKSRIKTLKSHFKNNIKNNRETLKKHPLSLIVFVRQFFHI